MFKHLPTFFEKSCNFLRIVRKFSKLRVKIYGKLLEFKRGDKLLIYNQNCMHTHQVHQGFHAIILQPLTAELKHGIVYWIKDSKIPPACGLSLMSSRGRTACSKTEVDGQKLSLCICQWSHAREIVQNFGHIEIQMSQGSVPLICTLYIIIPEPTTLLDEIISLWSCRRKSILVPKNS